MRLLFFVSAIVCYNLGMENISIRDIFVIGHLLGVIIGFGAAITSDFIFLSSIRDKKVSETEARFIQLASRIVWIGLFLIVVFGLALFALNPAGYLANPKFLAKMTIVGVLMLNGLIFHFSHIPRLVRHIGEHFPSSDEFIRKRPLLLISGAVSSSSWLSAFILASLHLTFSYTQIMGMYLIILFGAVSTAIILRKHILPDHKNN
jgi:hypothetical protein